MSAAARATILLASRKRFVNSWCRICLLGHTRPINTIVSRRRGRRRIFAGITISSDYPPRRKIIWITDNIDSTKGMRRAPVHPSRNRDSINNQIRSILWVSGDWGISGVRPTAKPLKGYDTFHACGPQPKTGHNNY